MAREAKELLSPDQLDRMREHAEAVDSRMSEHVLLLVAEVRRLRQALKEPEYDLLHCIHCGRAIEDVDDRYLHHGCCETQNEIADQYERERDEAKQENEQLRQNLRALSEDLEERSEERDQARDQARLYRRDIQQLAGSYQWEKQYAADLDEFPWLKESENG